MNPRTSRNASTPPTVATKPATSPATLDAFAPAIRAASRATAILDDVVLELDEHDLPREPAALEGARAAVLACCAPTIDALRVVDPERAGAVERLVVALSRAVRNLQARNGAIGPRVSLVHVEVQPFDFLQFDELRSALVALRTELEAALLDFPDRVELHAMRAAAAASPRTSDAPARSATPIRQSDFIHRVYDRLRSSGALTRRYRLDNAASRGKAIKALAGGLKRQSHPDFRVLAAYVVRVGKRRMILPEALDALGAGEAALGMPAAASRAGTRVA
ncbi:MAG: hypothetical protein U1E39_13225 [Planctomycetota bacterium]